jgi:hypothetical protein
VQVLKSASVCEIAGLVPAPEQKLSATVLPSDCVQETLRVWMALAEQLFDEALQLPGVQL